MVQVVPSDRIGYGIQLPVQSQSTIYAEAWERDAGPDEIAQVASAADRSGFLYVAVCDHTAIPRRLAQAMGVTWYDTIATLGWLAGLTTKTRLLSHVYVAALRNPLRTAKEFSTLDVLSKGRVIIGVGAGHVPEEFDAMGADFEGRGQLLDEAIDGINAALTEEFPVMEGPEWPARELSVGPRSVQQPRPPIWVGGSSTPALRRAAIRGDGWLPQTIKRSDLAEQIPKLLRFREEFRPGEPIELGALVPPIRLGTAIELPKGAISGGPDQIVETISGLAELGVSHVQIRFVSRSPNELCDQIEQFGSEVGPQLQR
ncbi:MAG: TIGR03619 family F420-dependent LLM class oxidoreductase [Acidimicrobiales bacterium]